MMMDNMKITRDALSNEWNCKQDHLIQKGLRKLQSQAALPGAENLPKPALQAAGTSWRGRDWHHRLLIDTTWAP